MLVVSALGFYKILIVKVITMTTLEWIVSQVLISGLRRLTKYERLSRGYLVVKEVAWSIIVKIPS